MFAVELISAMLNLIFLTTLYATLVTSQNDGAFSRQRLFLNYGVRLERLGSVKVVTDEWTHVFHLKLPPVEVAGTNIPFIRCARSADPIWELLQNYNITKHQKLAAKCLGDHGELVDLLLNVYHDYNLRIHAMVLGMYD